MNWSKTSIWKRICRKLAARPDPENTVERQLDVLLKGYLQTDAKPKRGARAASLVRDIDALCATMTENDSADSVLLVNQMRNLCSTLTQEVAKLSDALAAEADACSGQKRLTANARILADLYLKMVSEFLSDEEIAERRVGLLGSREVVCGCGEPDKRLSPKC
nr:hypothetical protein DBT41_14980 [Aerococcus urinae]